MRTFIFAFQFFYLLQKKSGKLLWGLKILIPEVDYSEICIHIILIVLKVTVLI